jgi:hypothetical protein
MRDKRSLLAFLGALALALAGLLLTAPAQAAVSPTHSTAAHVITLPAAPHGAAAVSPKSAAAVSPTVSPAVSTVHGAPGTPINCAAGNLCAFAWDPTTSDWKLFYLYTCNRYSLSNWLGTGGYLDKQTGGVTSYFYGQSGNVLASFTPDSTQHSYDWDPVWSIRNC